jgi:hypothetical protein
MRRKPFNRDTLIEALSFLQPVTPTDEDHQAHWYNEGYGQQIYSYQKMYIDYLKEKISKVRSKKEIQEIFIKSKILKPAPPITTSEQVKFWSEGFGLIIFNEYYRIISNFIYHINSLEGSEF